MGIYPTTGLNIATINNLAWLTGDWYGEDGDLRFDEQWSKPAGDTMMGMFRWIQGDQVRFYEFVTIELEGEECILRIKHFNPGLVGWEEKKDSVAFTLVEMKGEKAVFAKQGSPDPLWLVYQLEGKDTLIVGFENESGGSKPSDDVFVFKRRRE